MVNIAPIKMMMAWGGLMALGLPVYHIEWFVNDKTYGIYDELWGCM
jgi:hypothetical protein